MKHAPSGARTRAAILTCATLCAILPAHADKTWTGATDGNWATLTNWQEGALPDATEKAIFNGSSTANLTIDTTAARAVRGIALSTPAGAVTLNNNTVTIGKAGIDMSAATQNLQINSGVTIASEGRQLWNVANGRTLTVAALPNKPGVPTNNTGSLQVGTTGTVILGTATANIINDPQNNPWVTYGPNDWAALNAGTVVPATYTPVDGTTVTTLVGGAVNTITGNVTTANPTDMVALRYNEPTPYDVTVSNSGTSRTMTARGILVTANSGGGSLGGNLRNNAFVRPNRVSTNGSSFNIIQNSAGDFTIGAVLGNASTSTPVKLVKSGPGKLILLQDNGYSNGTYVDEGIVQFGDGQPVSGFVGFGFPGGGDIVNNGSLHFRRAADVTLVHNISGTGDLTQYGPGTLNLTTSVSTFTGPVNVLGGTLGVTSLTNLGNGSVVNIDNGATFKFLAAVDPSARTISVGSGGAAFDSNGLAVTLANPIAAGTSGVITKSGLGSLSLAAANTWTGGTMVNAGTLLASNASGSATGSGAVTVNVGGTLGGTGTISGAVAVASGGKVAPGASVGTLTVGGLALNAGATLDYEFSTTPANDRVTVSNSGGLTINGGAITLLQEGTANPFITPGTYNLISYTGAIGGAGVSSLSVANPQPGFTYVFGTSGGNVTLTIGTSGVVRNWLTNGDGSWASATNWNGTVPNGAGATANFQVNLSSPATVTLDGSKTVGFITFLSTPNGYTIAQGSGGSLTFNNGASNSSLLDGAGNHTISAPVVLASNTVVDTAAATDSMTLSGAISGTGKLTKTGPGTLSLLGSNTFSGTVTLSGGTTTFASGGLGTGALTIAPSKLVWAPGNTQDISNRTISFEEGIIEFDTNGNDVTLANDVGNSGFADLVKSGAGTLTLGAETTFSGTTTIAAGTLQLGTGGATGSVTGDIVNNGSLVINHAGPYQLLSGISGTGSLTHQGTGVLELVGVSTFSGPTTIASPTATLSLFNPLALQNSTLDYQNSGGTLSFDIHSAATLGGLDGDKNLDLSNSTASPVNLTVGGNNETTIYMGVLSGGGAFTKNGTGTMSFTAPQTYTGATFVGGGVLELLDGSSITTTTASTGTGAQLLINGGSLTSSAFSTIQSGAVGLRLNSGSVAYNGGVQSSQNDGTLIEINAGTFSALDVILRRTRSYGNAADPDLPAQNSGLVINGTTATEPPFANTTHATITNTLQIGTGNSSSSALVNGGELTVGGVVTVGNTSNNRWNVFEVRAGKFVSSEAAQGILLSPNATSSNRSQFLVTGGTATVERVTFGTATTAVDAIGRLTIRGGELYVGAGGLVQEAGTYTSQVQLFGGTIGAKANWSSSLAMTTESTFGIKAADALNAPHDITLSGAISGTGSLLKTGAGTLTLSGTYSYAGGTEIDAGTVILNTASLSDIGTVDIAAGAVLNLPHGQTDTVAALILDGVTQPAGTYTSANSGGRITGSGSIVVPGSDPFAGWIAGFPTLTGDAALKGSDPDGDGFTNIEEFAFNGLPNNSATSGKIRSRIETVGADQALVITLPVRNGATFDNVPGPGMDATVDNIAYTIQGSNNLTTPDQGISEVPASSTGMPTLDAGWTYHTFRLNGAVGGATPRGPRGFIATTAAPVP